MGTAILRFGLIVNRFWTLNFECRNLTCTMAMCDVSLKVKKRGDGMKRKFTAALEDAQRGLDYALLCKCHCDVDLWC